MHAIARASAASWNLLQEQIDRILDEARRLNALSGITGGPSDPAAVVLVGLSKV